MFASRFSETGYYPQNRTRAPVLLRVFERTKPAPFKTRGNPSIIAYHPVRGRNGFCPDSSSIIPPPHPSEFLYIALI
jgi:hypothetical protein